VWAWLLPMLVIGCSNLQLPDQTTETITQKRKRRSEETVRSFETQRNSAEYQAALGHWHQNNPRACEEMLGRLLKRNPQHRDARTLLAEIRLAQNRPAEAFEHVERALRDHPEDAQIRHTAGRVLDAAGYPVGALAYYERATRMEPTDESYALSYETALEATHRAEAGLVEPRWASASPVQHAVLRDERSAPQIDVAALLADGPADASDSVRFASHTEPADRGGSTDATDSTDPARTVENETILGLIRLGHAALVKGSAEAALTFFQEATALRPDNPQIPIFAAAASVRHHQPNLAIALLEPLRQRIPPSPKVLRILGAAYLRLGDHRSSQVALQQALSLDKSSALTYFLMGCTLAKLGQIESAQAHWRQAETMDSRYAVRQ